MKRIAAQKPLSVEALRHLALAYVGRYATSQAKLAAYLSRKLRERGWAGDQSAAAAIASLIEDMVRLRYIDDLAYAEMKADGLSRRGYGARRVRQALGAAGISEDAAQEALDLVAPDKAAIALAYARRRRLGPFSKNANDPKQRERDFAAMMRAGHDYATIRRILDLEPEVVHIDDARSEL